MKFVYFILIVVIAIAFISSAFLLTQKNLLSACDLEEINKDIYLSKIHKYIEDNNLADPTKYTKIVDVYQENYNGKDVCVMHLDCCFTGDEALVDKSGEVIRFRFGPQ